MRIKSQFLLVDVLLMQHSNDHSRTRRSIQIVSYVSKTSEGRKLILTTSVVPNRFLFETTWYEGYHLWRRKLIWIKLKMKRSRNEAVFTKKQLLLHTDLLGLFALHNMKAFFDLQHRRSNLLRCNVTRVLAVPERKLLFKERTKKSASVCLYHHRHKKSSVSSETANIFTFSLFKRKLSSTLLSFFF